jgi:hypothetical protein
LRRRRSDPLGLQDARNPEVHQLHEIGISAAPHEIDVLGFDVAVHDPGRMHRPEPSAELHDHDQCALERRCSVLVELVGQ